MQETVNQRINLLVNHFTKGVKAPFAQQIGISQQGIHNLLSGRQGEPSFKVLAGILKAYPSVSADWLLTGQGEMLRGQAPGPTPPAGELAQLTQEYRQLSKELEGRKATYREAANDLAQLRAEVQHQEAGLRVELEHLPNFNEEAQALMQEIIRLRREEIKHAQERYNAFLPLHEQAEAELLKTHKHYAEVDARITNILFPD